MTEFPLIIPLITCLVALANVEEVAGQNVGVCLVRICVDELLCGREGGRTRGGVGTEVILLVRKIVVVRGRYRG